MMTTLAASWQIAHRYKCIYWSLSIHKSFLIRKSSCVQFHFTTGQSDPDSGWAVLGQVDDISKYRSGVHNGAACQDRDSLPRTSPFSETESSGNEDSRLAFTGCCQQVDLNALWPFLAIPRWSCGHCLKGGKGHMSTVRKHVWHIWVLIFFHQRKETISCL